MTSVAAALASARAAFRDAGIDTAALDARLLLGAAAGLDPGSLPTRPDEPVAPAAEEVLAGYVQRRIAGWPVARILGVKEFWGLPFRLSDATLEPRPDTETLVAAALEEARAMGRPDLRICDLGTGSGAILIALLRELPKARGIATDISEAAIAMARDNAEALGVLDRVGFAVGDFAVVPTGRFDIVTVNPPYIESATVSGLAAEVRDHDPLRALDGGVDGLDGYRVIAGRADALLEPAGVLLLEIGAGQAAAVAAICRSGGLVVSRLAADLAGIERVIVARRATG